MEKYSQISTSVLHPIHDLLSTQQNVQTLGCHCILTLRAIKMLSVYHILQ